MLNPPYKGQAGDFVAKLVAEYRTGNVSAAILLVNAYSTDADWFAPLWDALLCFTDHRVDVDGHGPKGNSTNNTVFAYFGPDREAFEREFSKFGAIMTGYRRNEANRPPRGARRAALTRGREK